LIDHDNMQNVSSLIMLRLNAHKKNCKHCGQAHLETPSSSDENPLCINCKQSHDSDSVLCRVSKKEQDIIRFKSERTP